MDTKLYKKLIILYIFENINVPLYQDTISQIVIDNGWISLIEFLSILNSLIESNFIIKIKNQKNAPYVITDEGRQCIVTFSDTIPNSLKEEIKNVIDTNRMNYRKSQEYIADYTKNKDGTYCVTLIIKGADQNELEIKLQVPDRNQAKWMHKKWTGKASQIYELLFTELMD